MYTMYYGTDCRTSPGDRNRMGNNCCCRRFERLLWEWQVKRARAADPHFDEKVAATVMRKSPATRPALASQLEGVDVA